MRRLTAALLVGLGLALLYPAARLLERGVDLLVRRIGAVPTLLLVGALTVGLARVWLRHGGSRVLRSWGVELKPARPVEADPEESPPRQARERGFDPRPPRL